MNVNGNGSTVTESGSIADRAMLVSLSIRQWSASKHDKRITAEIAIRHGSDESMGRFSKKLISRDALEKIRKIAQQARLDHYARTLPWGDDGYRILSSAGYFDYARIMADHKLNYEYARKEFMLGYPNYYAAAQASLNGLFDPADYPAPDEIERKFEFTSAVGPVPQASDFRVCLGDEETARIQADIESRVKSTLQTAMADVWARIDKVVRHMSERLHAYQVTADGTENIFRDSLVANVRELIGLLPTLNITGDSNIAQIAREMDRLIEFDADTLREQDTIRADVAARADSILKQIEDFI